MTIKFNEKKLLKHIRFILTVGLLWQVWAHSHWSVALSLTLVFVAVEAGVAIFDDLSHWEDRK